MLAILSLNCNTFITLASSHWPSPRKEMWSCLRPTQAWNLSTFGFGGSGQVEYWFVTITVMIGVSSGLSGAKLRINAGTKWRQSLLQVLRNWTTKELSNCIRSNEKIHQKHYIKALFLATHSIARRPTGPPTFYMEITAAGQGGRELSRKKYVTVNIVTIRFKYNI